MTEIQHLTPEENARRILEQEKLIAALLANPVAAKLALDVEDEKESLLTFVKNHWSILEPGRPFKTGWAIEAILEFLEAITRKQILRGLINVPPGFMKSLSTNVFWPAWEWGPKAMPYYRYVAAAYSETLTFRDNGKFGRLITSDLYKAKYGHLFDVTKTGEVRVGNDKTGFKLATSVSGVGTGERGDRFIIDDPHNVKDIQSDPKRKAALSWCAESVPTRINDPMESAILCIMQRVHEHDVANMLIEQGYTVLSIPMYFEEKRKCFVYYKSGELFWQDPRTKEGQMAWPEHYPEEYVKNTLIPMLMAEGEGDHAVTAQLQQRPTPRGGAMFKRKWFEGRIIKSIPEPVVKRTRAWDLAGSTRKRSPRTSTSRLAKGKSNAIYVEHNYAFRGSPGDVETAVRTYATADRDLGLQVKQIIPQDPGQAGKSQVKQYVGGALAGFDFQVVREGAYGDKEARARAFAAQCEFHNVWIVAEDGDDWVADFLDELCSFPVGRYRDRVDSTSLSYLMLVERQGEDRPAPGMIVHPEAESQDDTGY